MANLSVSDSADGTGEQTGQESRSAGHRTSPSVTGMTSIESVTLDVADPTVASRFYTTAFGFRAPARSHGRGRQQVVLR